MAIWVMGRQEAAGLLEAHRQQKAERIEKNMGRLVEAYRQERGKGKEGAVLETLKEIKSAPSVEGFQSPRRPRFDLSLRWDWWVLDPRMLRQTAVAAMLEDVSKTTADMEKKTKHDCSHQRQALAWSGVAGYLRLPSNPVPGCCFSTKRVG